MRLIWKLLLTVIALAFVVVAIAVLRMPSQDELDQLAADGKTEGSAPVQAHVAIEIHAGQDKVWALLTDVADWPKWQPAIVQTEMAGEASRWRTFAWSSGGMQIHSEFQLVEPKNRLAWTGKAYWARAIHVWRLESLPGGGTRVTVDESMDGFLIGRLFPSAKLQASDDDWLRSLKAAAEK